MVEKLKTLCGETNKQVKDIGGLNRFSEQSVADAVKQFQENLLEINQVLHTSITGLDEEAKQMENDICREGEKFAKLAEEAEKWHDAQDELLNRPATERSFARAQIRIKKIKDLEMERAPGLLSRISVKHKGLAV